MGSNGFDMGIAARNDDSKDHAVDEQSKVASLVSNNNKDVSMAQIGGQKYQVDAQVKMHDKSVDSQERMHGKDIGVQKEQIKANVDMKANDNKTFLIGKSMDQQTTMEGLRLNNQVANRQIDVMEKRQLSFDSNFKEYNANRAASLDKGIEDYNSFRSSVIGSTSSVGRVS